MLLTQASETHLFCIRLSGMKHLLALLPVVSVWVSFYYTTIDSKHLDQLSPSVSIAGILLILLLLLPTTHQDLDLVGFSSDFLVPSFGTYSNFSGFSTGILEKVANLGVLSGMILLMLEMETTYLARDLSYVTQECSNL